MLDLNKNNFDSNTKGNLPIIVDFWAPWCQPCRVIAPIFEKIYSEYKGKLRFAMVNVDENQEIAGKNGVRGIPCLILFNKGKEIDRIVGAVKEEQLKNKINEILSKVV